MKESKLLAKAIQIASEAFKDDFDKGGAPYILHCLWVMNNVRHLGYDVMIVAILHDLLEDKKDWTEQRLYDEGFSILHVKALDLLNHDKSKMSYEEYIKRMASHSSVWYGKAAVQVKLSDLEHNMKPNRLRGLTKKDHDRMDKYMRWFIYLKDLVK